MALVSPIVLFYICIQGMLMAVSCSFSVSFIIEVPGLEIGSSGVVLEPEKYLRFVFSSNARESYFLTERRYYYF
jgi:hypothetical protein